MSLGNRDAPRVKDADVAALAKSLLFEYRRSKSLSKSIRSAIRSSALPKKAKILMNKLLISQTLTREESSVFNNDNLAELFSILAFGVGSGSNVDEALGIFIRRVEAEISLRNKMKVKVGGAQALTYLGMSVFFPLFSGISSVIFNSSLGFFGGGTAVSSGFEVACAAYVPIILCISASFAHPERSFARNSLSVVPYVAVALSVMFFVPIFLLNLL
jgi:hypothetical protein